MQLRISDFGLLDPDGDPDRHRNLSPSSLGHVLPLQEISLKSVHNFFSYPTYIQTDRQTDRILDGQCRARREAARRRNSECKINLSSLVQIPLATMAVGLQRSGDWLAARRSDQCAEPAANHRCAVGLY